LAKSASAVGALGKYETQALAGSYRHLCPETRNPQGNLGFVNSEYGKYYLFF
jgi:hypothetical protein